jgi:hypothetical protein
VSMNVTFRPIENWPNRRPLRSPDERERSRFDSSRSQTLNLLTYELGRLGASAAVVRLALEDSDIRRDGWPRASARPEHPGVVVEWLTRSGWSRMTADKYTNWQDNIRSVALSLEALRSVERWGAVEGEQYEGLQLELEEAGASPSAAQELLDSYGGPKEALKATHPDHGGDPEEFRRVQEARKVLGL